VSVELLVAPLENPSAAPLARSRQSARELPREGLRARAEGTEEHGGDLRQQRRRFSTLPRWVLLCGAAQKCVMRFIDFIIFFVCHDAHDALANKSPFFIIKDKVI
jgi:hypothetical protein